MKIIKTEAQTVTGSSASSTNSNFPLANLFDNHPRQVWKANGVNEATLRLKNGADANALGIYGTNADDVVCTVTKDSDEQTLNNAAATDEGGGVVGIPCTGHGYSTDDQVLFNDTTNYDGVYTVLSSGTADRIDITETYAAETFAGTETVAEVQATETFDLQVIDDYVHFFNDDPVIYRQFWMDFEYQMYASTATIKLTAPTGEVVKAGVYKAGPGVVFSGPRYGIKEGRKDYSVKKQLRNGAWYGKKKVIVRTFSGQVRVERDTAYYAFAEIYDLKGPDPFAILIVDGLTDKRWTAYVMFDKPFVSNHAHPEHSLVSFQLIEVT